MNARNYRSFILKTLPIRFEIGNLLLGLGVNVHRYKNEQEQPKKVANIVQQLIKQGFTQDEICIISCKGGNKSVFSKLDKIANLPLSYFTGDYDENGQQIMTDGQLHFDSIYRFKGLESPAVILVDIDFEKLNKHQQHVLFCGMTRATVKLGLLVNIEKAGSQEMFRDDIK